MHAEEKGHPLAGALVIQAQVSRMRRTVRAEEEAAKAGVKLVVPVTMIFGAMLLVILAPVLIKVTHQLSTGSFSAAADVSTDRSPS